MTVVRLTRAQQNDLLWSDCEIVIFKALCFGGALRREHGQARCAYSACSRIGASKHVLFACCLQVGWVGGGLELCLSNREGAHFKSTRSNTVLHFTLFVL
jgi:hypothetical protein